MASSFFALFDDIATLLDDIAVLSKVAAKKTAGVLGDDLALNAQQVTGIAASREIPVVWGVAKGSFVNKLILVPSALAISAVAPWLVGPLLVIGGAYLCFEGVEKVVHALLHGKEGAQAHVQAALDASVDLASLEKEKIKGAIRTDFVLSAEIVVITLGTVSTVPFLTRLTVLSLVALLMTVGVYGLVALIVKLDDLGLHLHRTGRGPLRVTGSILLAAAPKLMRALSVVGTAAMFLVGGSIVLHGLPFLAHALHPLLELGHGIPVLATLDAPVVEGLTGAVAGFVVLGAISLAKKLRHLSRPGRGRSSEANPPT
jgi:hypothetical protein